MPVTAQATNASVGSVPAHRAEPDTPNAAKRLLMIVSSAREIRLADGTPHETGYFAEELLIPYEQFVAHGMDVTIATPDGRAPHADPYGLEEIFHFPDQDVDFLASVTRTFMPDADDIRLTLHHLAELGLAGARRIHEGLIRAGVQPGTAREQVSAAARIAWSEDREFGEVLLSTGLGDPLSDAQVRDAIEALTRDSRAASEQVTARLAAISGLRDPGDLTEFGDDQIREFDAVFVPGGHGPMVDLVDNPDIARVIGALHDNQATVAALCHGQAYLLSAPARADGQWLFDGYRLTSLTDEEEDQTKLGKLGMPWYLETALKNAGAVFDDAGAAWTSHVVVDRNLITGQNPQSADAVADAILKHLEVR
jgi:putative intracellular protease/amidase